MIYPTIKDLAKGEYNRYELALATARCARLITDEYVRQHDVAEKSQTGNKETDRPINTMIDRELRDEKAVHVAVNRLNEGAYVIDVNAGDIEEPVLAAPVMRVPDFAREDLLNEDDAEEDTEEAIAPEEDSSEQ